MGEIRFEVTIPDGSTWQAANNTVTQLQDSLIESVRNIEGFAGAEISAAVILAPDAASPPPPDASPPPVGRSEPEPEEQGASGFTSSTEFLVGAVVVSVLMFGLIAVVAGIVWCR